MAKQCKICWGCERSGLPLRARTFYMPGMHETYYSCYGCDAKACVRTERKLGRALKRDQIPPWEDCPAVPGTGCDSAKDADPNRE
jgi:hypothetical protein